MVVRYWSILFKLFWMSIPIRWCIRWRKWMLWTPSRISSFFKSFKWWKTNYLIFSPLFIIFMSFNFHCFSMIIYLREICLSSFHLWTRIMVIRLSNLFLPSFIFCFALFLEHFSLMFFSLIWLTTPISMTLPMLSLCFCSFWPPSWPLWGW